MKLSEKEVLNFLQQIEQNKIVLVPVGIPQYIYAGNVLYRASNGWEIIIFNDCNEWDYIDYVKSSDGKELYFDDIEPKSELDLYRPSEEIVWKIYRIPGYLHFVCLKCKQELNRYANELNSFEDFICKECGGKGCKTDRPCHQCGRHRLDGEETGICKICEMEKAYNNIIG